MMKPLRKRHDGPCTQILIGLALISLVFVAPRVLWSWIGLVPLLTGVFKFSPAYKLPCLSTCPAMQVAEAGRETGEDTRSPIYVSRRMETSAREEIGTIPGPLPLLQQVHTVRQAPSDRS